MRHRLAAAVLLFTVAPPGAHAAGDRIWGALVLATILPRVDLSRIGRDPVRAEGDATLRPKGGLRMRVARR